MRTNPFQALPDYVELGGRRVPIDPDFRVGVAIEMEALQAEEPDVSCLLSLFYRNAIPGDLAGAVQAMLDFFKGYDQRREKKVAGKHPGRCYDFAQDGDVLLSSFLAAYGIDLSTASLHWWTFRRLMFNLPPDSLFMQRIQYRTADLNKLPKSQRKHYKKMRELYAIKAPARSGPSMTAQERDEALMERVRRRFEEAQSYGDENGP